MRGSGVGGGQQRRSGAAAAASISAAAEHLGDALHTAKTAPSSFRQAIHGSVAQTPRTHSGHSATADQRQVLTERSPAAFSWGTWHFGALSIQIA